MHLLPIHFTTYLCGKLYCEVSRGSAQYWMANEIVGEYKILCVWFDFVQVCLVLCDVIIVERKQFCVVPRGRVRVSRPIHNGWPVNDPLFSRSVLVRCEWVA